MKRILLAAMIALTMALGTGIGASRQPTLQAPAADAGFRWCPVKC